MRNLTPAAVKVLEALATYQYLTPSLVVMIKILTHRGAAVRRTAREQLFPQLVGRRLVDWRTFPFPNSLKSKDNLYCLNARGARFLGELWGVDPKEIRYPSNIQKLRQDIDHRVALVKFHIQFMHWLRDADGICDAFDRYFGRVANPKPHRRGLVSATTVFHQDGKIVPDAIVKFSANGVERLCAVEIHHNDRTGRIIQQLTGYLPALQERAISLRYGYEGMPFILSIFDEANVLELTKKRFLGSKALAPASKGFLFNTLEQVCDDITQGWHYANGKEARIFPAP